MEKVNKIEGRNEKLRKVEKEEEYQQLKNNRKIEMLKELKIKFLDKNL